MSKLRLNDFASFNKFLFKDSGPNWNKFFDEKNSVFCPPILKPKTIVEYQVNHYVLWMVISAFKLNAKPEIFVESADVPYHKCYACEYSAKKANPYSIDCKTRCPIVLDDDYCGCGSKYDYYITLRHIASDYYVSKELKRVAESIAKLEWREI